MGRRRWQSTGFLHKRGRSWIGHWREDVRGIDGQIRRQKFSAVVARATGPEKKTMREARRIFQETILSKLDDATRRPQSLATVREFVESRFRPDVVFQTRSRHYETTLKHLLDSPLADMRLRDIGAQDCQEWLSGKLAAGYAGQTVKHLRNTLSAVFKHAKGLEFFAGDNPVQYVRLPSVQAKQRGSLTAQQVSALVRELEEPYATFCLMLATTGLRAGEALGLTWRWLNLTDRDVTVAGEVVYAQCLRVVQTWREGAWSAGKNSASRGIVPVPAILRQRLEAWRLNTKWNGDDHPVFCVQGGKPFRVGTAGQKKLKPALRRLGLSGDISWHWMRHTLATLADGAGLTEGERQRLLRHSSVEMTRHYTHADLARLRAGQERVAAMIAGEVN